MRRADALNLRHLRAVASIVARGSLSAASGDVALSQPALTQGMTKLEAQIGASLFDRRSTGMTATGAGAAIASRVRTAAAILSDGVRAARGRGTRAGFARADLLLTMVHLRAVTAVAREGSYIAAAHATGVSQPAVHRAIQDLERLSGVTVVARRGRGIMLTEAGARLARAARLAIGEIQAGLDEVDEMHGAARGRIAIGAMPLARAWLLPTAIARFHAAETEVAFDIAEGSHAELIEPLRDGEFDMLIGALRDPSPGSDLVQEPLFVDRPAVFARGDHPLAGRRGIPLAELAGQPWLASRADTPLRVLWHDMFAAADVALPEVWMECGSVMILRGMMLEGDYLALLSPDQLWMELRTGMLCTLDVAQIAVRRTIGITTRAGWHPTPAQARFLDLLRRTAMEHSNQRNQ